MIIWRGWGILVPVVLLLGLATVQLIVDRLFGDGFYTQTKSVQSMAIIGISVAIGLCGFSMNRGRSYGERHSFFFIPVEYWGIIAPIILFGGLNYSAESNAQDLKYLRAPEVNDLYVADLTELFEIDNPKFKYGVMKVVGVSSSFVRVVVGNVTYDQSSGPRGDVRDGSAKKREYYNPKTFEFEYAELESFKNDKIIYSVYRG